MIDRTPKPCLHKIANHQHGTRACYVLDRCRCVPCKDANRAAERERTKLHLYGRWNGYVPADAARAHVRSLQAQGMGWKRVAKAAGLNSSVLWKLLYGDASRNLAPSKRIRPKTEAAILAARCDLADGAVIDGTGTTRRIQALVALGWSQSKIAVRLGILPTNLGPLAHGTRAVTVATARAVSALYDELWDQQPPAEDHRDKIARSRAMRYAKAHGWLPPLAWDDDSIDDPRATANAGEPEAASGGRKAHIEDVEWLAVEQGHTMQQVADRLGVKRGSIERVCLRHERRDLLDRMRRNAIAQENAA